MRQWVGVCTGTMKPLPYQQHIPLQLILWEYHRALKCFALASLDQKELFNFPSNALFCILEVWKNFIRTVVPHVYLAVVQTSTATKTSEIISTRRTRQFQISYLKVWPQRTNWPYFANFCALAKRPYLVEPWEQKLVTEKCE